MKKDLENKDRMLSMYENSMADLSSKVHHLKKSLEEKVGTVVVYIHTHSPHTLTTHTLTTHTALTHRTKK